MDIKNMAIMDSIGVEIGFVAESSTSSGVNGLSNDKNIM